MMTHYHLCYYVIYYILFKLLIIDSQTVIYGYKNYTEYYSGNVNIFISVPHDGKLLPSTITNRTADASNNLLGDYNTRLLALTLKDELTNLLIINSNQSINNVPFILFNNLHRIKMDPNRVETESCAVITEESFIAYTDYHNFIANKFEKEFMEQNPKYKQGLLIDIHGQSHADDWIEIGYLLTSTQLNKPNELMNPEISSIRLLASASKHKFNDMIRGSVSLGGIMENKFNLKAVPSPKYPGPNNGGYYNGGYITKTYGSVDCKSSRINAIQIESPYSLRQNSIIKTYAKQLAMSIYEYYIMHNLHASCNNNFCNQVDINSILSNCRLNN